MENGNGENPSALKDAGQNPAQTEDTPKHARHGESGAVAAREQRHNTRRLEKRRVVDRIGDMLLPDGRLIPPFVPETPGRRRTGSEPTPSGHAEAMTDQPSSENSETQGEQPHHHEGEGAKETEQRGEHERAEHKREKGEGEKPIEKQLHDQYIELLRSGNEAGSGSYKADFEYLYQEITHGHMSVDDLKMEKVMLVMSLLFVNMFKALANIGKKENDLQGPFAEAAEDMGNAIKGRMQVIDAVIDAVGKNGRGGNFGKISELAGEERGKREEELAGQHGLIVEINEALTDPQIEKFAQHYASLEDDKEKSEYKNRLWTGSDEEKKAASLLTTKLNIEKRVQSLNTHIAWSTQVTDPKAFIEPDHKKGFWAHFKHNRFGANPQRDYRRARVKKLEESTLPVAA